MRFSFVIALFVYLITAVGAQDLRLPAEPGSELALAADDWGLPLQEQHSWQFHAAAPEAGQVVLNFRARIDNPHTLGSTNILRIELNGELVGLKTPRRQLRLVNKSNRFPWNDPPFLTWFIPNGQWRLAYAPDFDILRERQYYGPQAYHFTLDVTDLVTPGENELTFIHTSNPNVARNAGSDLTVVFRDLRLEVREGPGVLPGTPSRPERFRPFAAGTERATGFTVQAAEDGSLLLHSAGHDYRLQSFFYHDTPDGEYVEEQLHHADDGGQLQVPPYRVQRKLVAEPARGRLLVTDTITNTSDSVCRIHMKHTVSLLDGRCERVNFGGREEYSLESLNRPEAPYLFLSRDESGLGIVAYDDVLRTHAQIFYDDESQSGGLHDEWFGLPAGESYTMTWAVYTTAGGNVFDLVNLIRRDWEVSFPILGGFNFFEPDRLLEYDDEQLQKHLEMLNINVAMSQGGWIDFKLHRAGDKNIGHGPIVAGEFYADFRVRLRQAMEKLRRLRPGIKCLVYYDTWLAAGEGIEEKYADSLYTRFDGRPRNFQAQTEWGFPLANFIPTLENTLGREILEKIPPMIIDELAADGLYWDEIIHSSFQNSVCYNNPDGYTYVRDQNGELIAVGAPELASQGLKLEFARAFTDRSAIIVGNGPPATMTEQQQLRFPRFTETGWEARPGQEAGTWLFTPISYAAASVTRKIGVTEEDFLEDIKEKLWHANLYLYSSHVFYHLFTRENLATYQYPITILELDEGVIIGQERILSLRPGRFGWAGENWRGELILFDAEQHIIEQRNVTPEGGDGFIDVDLQPGQAMVIVRTDINND